MSLSKFDNALNNKDFNSLAISAKSVTDTVTTAIKRYKGGREAIHFASCVALQHAVTTGDTRAIKRLLVEMGSRSQTRHRLAAWIRHHNTKKVNGKVKHYLSAGINKDGNVTVKICKEAERKHIDVQAMFDAPYWDVLDVAPVKTPYELDATTFAFVTRALKEGCQLEDIRKAVTSAAKKAAKVANKAA